MEVKKGGKPAKSVLGRGLSALISTPVPIQPPTSTPVNNDFPTTASNLAIKHAEQGGETTDAPRSRVSFIDINKIVGNPAQPRQEFKEAEIVELAESIRALGVIQPILVRPAKYAEAGNFEIVAGERRWRASKLAGLKQVPCISQDLSDRETLEIALVENIQRSNLNPVEEAKAYQRLMDEFSLGQEEVAQRVGKDRASVSNYIRVLKLPPAVIELLREGKLSMGHAKAILTIKEPAAQISLAKKVINENLSVRALEQIVSRVVVLDNGPASKLKKSTSTQDQINPFPEVVDRMRNTLGTKVTVRHHNSGRGRIEIEYFSEQELDRVVEHICK
ncbi:MAG: ParB/RepB/Spo0J family partition protein [Deltaproteobacteria bacterium]|nr:ParB/RepB/Spo0J family partition protein [Deltaproteobacteria bacterium]